MPLCLLLSACWFRNQMVLYGPDSRRHDGYGNSLKWHANRDNNEPNPEVLGYVWPTFMGGGHTFINGMLGSNFLRSIFSKKRTYVILAVLLYVAFYDPWGVMHPFHDYERIAEQIYSYEETIALYSLRADGTGFTKYYPVAEINASVDSGQSKLRYRLFPFLYFPISVEYTLPIIKNFTSNTPLQISVDIQIKTCDSKIF